MSASSSTNLIKKTILKKPFLITKDELSNIGQSLNIVGYDNQLNLNSDDSIITLKYENSSSPKLLNWVEPYTINGITKTLFYTEVNSGFKIGERVFIINGTYDSNELIKKNKYKRGTDGYKVLYVDRCIVVLDINFTGLLPTNESSQIIDQYDEYIKVYYVKDEKDFLLVNRQLTSGFTTASNIFESDNKFNKNQNNFIYVDKGYSNISGWGRCNISPNTEGFYYRNGLDWENITIDLLSPNYITLLSSNIETNYKMIIINGTFTFASKEFKEGSVYEFDGNSWIITVKHENNNVPIITKSNFRDGYFNGKWNGGCYGSNVKRIKWNKNDSIWNSGTLLNVQWKWGFLNSIYSQPESYSSEFDENNKPFQRITNPDNDGYGYNFIINSELENYVIGNGNLSNSQLGFGVSYSIVADHLNGLINDLYISNTFTQSLVNKSVFDNCYIINANIENSIVKDSRGYNSRFNNVKSVNSHYTKSVFKNSNYISDNVIKILDIYRSSIDFPIIIDNDEFIFYKFYINKRSFEKFKFKDTFYIKGLKIKDSNKIIDFFDKKFKIGPFIDYVDSYNDIKSFYKEGIEYSAFLSTPLDNKLFRNDYSIDIFIRYSINDIPIDINKIDFNSAYILNSDFESGIFENSNWNSGYHFNYNNDNNIVTNIQSNINSFYYNNLPIYDINVDILNNNLIVNTPTKYSETELDYYDNGEILFLNNIIYDTHGSVLEVSISNSGSGYISDDIVVNSSNGIKLGLSYQADNIGGVISLTLNSSGTLMGSNSIHGVTGGSGYGLTLQINDEGDIFEIIDPGYNYQIGDIVTILSPGVNASYEVTNISIGSIYSVYINTPGIGYNIGESLNIANGNDGVVTVTKIGGSKQNITDTYIVNSYRNTQLIISPLNGILGITQSHGIFTTDDVDNRYNYINKVKFYKSKIVSGIFKRSYFENCLIKNNVYNVNDREFSNIQSIKELVISDTVFKSNKNILSNAIYINSFVIGDRKNILLSDTWDNGILYNSTWNKLDFTNGLVKNSTWIYGDFLNGTFYNNRSFDNIGNTASPYYYNNRIASYYKGGLVNIANNIYNDRHSWQNGIFVGGEFYKSDWENGIFYDGKFYYSKFYDGKIKGGIIGDITVPDTFIYNGTIDYTTVENARVYSDTPNQNIIWNDGIFNNGIFGANILSNATWYNGSFNGGQFIDNSSWVNGIFNNGRFLSNYKYQSYINNVSNGIFDISDYSWQNGIFNGGEFGNESLNDNSTWYNGEFNGGIFKGKEWRKGVFLYGEFRGSGATAIGGATCSNSKDFVDSYYSNSYYGLWRDGFITDIKDKFIDNSQYTNIKRVTDSNISKISNIKNVLWLSGTFSHPGAVMNNSVWLSGTFENGTFEKSSFNPFVVRSLSSLPSFNIDDSCIWKNGKLIDSEFYISKWLNGNFISGTGVGMLWNYGIVNYMNAYNVNWNDGVWKNGNWNGSSFNIPVDGIITDEYVRQILLRGMSASGTSSCHIWNLFYQDNLSNINNSSSSNFNELILGGSTSDNPPTSPISITIG